MGPNKLPLDNMAERHRGLTPEVAAAYVQAARVCLDRHHESPTEFSIHREDRVIPTMVVWGVTDQRTRAAWANETDTTEQGAYAMVLAAVELTHGMVALRRAETTTGADYYVGLPQTRTQGFETMYRLEIAGRDRASDRIVYGTLLEKVEQARKGRSNLPAMAGVVGFLSRLIMLRMVEDE
jgi:hypothetical protein